jgi:hypothetical protein
MRRSADTSWRLMNAAMLLMVLMVSFAFAPDAMAHGSDHASSVISAVAPALGDSVHPAVAASETVAAAYVQSASWQSAGADQSCPNDPNDGRADHIGCCGGIVSCASGGGAAIPSEEPLPVSALKAALACSMTPVSVGTATIPDDPPPRISI